MKKIKVVAIVSGVLTLLQLFPVIFYGVTQIGYGIKVASSIGIIGSADGPTAVYVVNGVNMLPIFARYALLLLCAVTFIVSTVMCLKKKK